MVAVHRRILDVLLTDRCNFALLKVAVSIMKLCERKLRTMADLEDILGLLKIEVPGEMRHDAAYTGYPMSGMALSLCGDDMLVWWRT